MTQVDPTSETPPAQDELKWFTPGVRGIGLASFLADMGHEVPTALFASLVVSVLGASAAVLGLIEGVADGLAGLARMLGGPLADSPATRRKTAIGGYLSTAALAALIGAAGVQRARSGKWPCCGWPRGPRVDCGSLRAMRCWPIWYLRQSTGEPTVLSV
ncbi:MAG TPA: hypothetical protein VF043_06675 [Ktedonobacteraceae bacterium]